MCAGWVNPGCAWQHRHFRIKPETLRPTRVRTHLSVHSPAGSESTGPKDLPPSLNTTITYPKLTILSWQSHLPRLCRWLSFARMTAALFCLLLLFAAMKDNRRPSFLNMDVPDA
jgi:hypothetical protein